jgi:peptidoglycan/xylan/chitin deacetylase (PgdA/CDA1 family)
VRGEHGVRGAPVTLSFDNGPDPDATPAVLDVLARRNVRASFFVVGDRLREPGARILVERARAEGHWVGNHSMTHSVPLGELRNPATPEQEIGATQALLGPLSHPDRLFRPFGGGGHLDTRLLSEPARDYLIRDGYTCVLWNAVPRDWEDEEGWVDTGLRQCEGLDWPLVVLHDIAGGAMRHLDRFIGLLADSGCVFRQDFPPDCVPIRRGRLVGRLDGLVAAA